MAIQWLYSCQHTGYKVNRLQQAMSREFERHPGNEHSIQLLRINDEDVSQSDKLNFTVNNIGKGGFRFEADIALQLEDRVQVLLHFPDGFQQQVLGRVCYCDELEDGRWAYGFSIIDGFYSMQHSLA